MDLPEEIDFKFENGTKSNGAGGGAQGSDAIGNMNDKEKNFGSEIQREIFEDFDPATGETRRQVVERRLIVSQHEVKSANFID